MTQISSQLFAQDGTPLAGLTVESRLMASSAWLASRVGQVIGEENDVTDTTGTWLLNLTPTGDYEDTGAFYLLIDPTGQTPFTVPDDDGQVHQLRDLILEAPNPNTPAQPGLISADPGNDLTLHANGLYLNVPVWFGRVGDTPPADQLPDPTLCVFT
jgi:hypothetical protein